MHFCKNTYYSMLLHLINIHDLFIGQFCRLAPFFSYAIFVPTFPMTSSPKSLYNKTNTTWFYLFLLGPSSRDYHDRDSLSVPWGKQGANFVTTYCIYATLTEKENIYSRSCLWKTIHANHFITQCSSTFKNKLILIMMHDMSNF